MNYRVTEEFRASQFAMQPYWAMGSDADADEDDLGKNPYRFHNEETGLWEEKSEMAEVGDTLSGVEGRVVLKKQHFILFSFRGRHNPSATFIDPDATFIMPTDKFKEHAVLAD